MKKLLKKITILITSVLMAFTVMSVTGCNKGGTKILNDGTLQLTSFNVKEKEQVVEKRSRKMLRNGYGRLNANDAEDDSESYYALLNDEKPTLVATVKNVKNLVFFEIDIKFEDSDTEIAFMPWGEGQSSGISVEKVKVDDVWTTLIYITPDVVVDTYDAKKSIIITNIVFFNISDKGEENGEGIDSSKNYSKVGAYIDSAPKSVTFFKYVGPDATALYTPKDADGKPGMLEYGIKYDTVDERYEASVKVNSNYKSDEKISRIVIPDSISLKVLTEDTVKSDGGAVDITATVTYAKFNQIQSRKGGLNAEPAGYELSLPDSLQDADIENVNNVCGPISKLKENDVNYIGNANNQYVYAFSERTIKNIVLNSNVRVLGRFNTYETASFEFDGENPIFNVTDDKKWILSKDNKTAFLFACDVEGDILLPYTVEKSKLCCSYFTNLEEGATNKCLVIQNEKIAESTTLLNLVSSFMEWTTFNVIVPFGSFNKFSKLLNDIHGYDDSISDSSLKNVYKLFLSSMIESYGNKIGAYTDSNGLSYALYDSGYAEVTGCEIAENPADHREWFERTIRIEQEISYMGRQYITRRIHNEVLFYLICKNLIIPGTINSIPNCQSLAYAKYLYSVDKSTANIIFEKTTFGIGDFLFNPCGYVLAEDYDIFSANNIKGYIKIYHDLSDII